jgi:hypothetical protein
MDELLKKVVANLTETHDKNTSVWSLARRDEFSATFSITEASIFYPKWVTPTPGILFIDGGNNKILDMQLQQVYLVHVAAIQAIPEKPFKSSRRTVIVLIRKKTNDKEEAVIYSQDGKERIVAFQKEEGKEAIDRVRRLLEIEYAMEQAIDFERNSLIILDGSLECKTNEEKRAMDKLTESLIGNNQLLAGIAKTTTFICDDSRGIYEVLPKVDKISSIHVANLLQPKAKVFMTKLHEASPYWFRCDIQDIFGVDANRVLGQLATLSNDAAFVGYPYPLIKADMLARVTHEESGAMKTRLMVFAKDKFPDMEDLCRQVDVHSVLDKMRF